LPPLLSFASRAALLTLTLLPASSPPDSVQRKSADFPVPLGLPPIPWPEDNPYSPARAELGKLLFFDGRLSANGVVSCAFCHEPAHAFAASTPLSRGANGKPGVRHAQTIINRAWGKSQFWDGRAATLESQVITPVTNPDEMGMTADQVVQRLRGIEGYAALLAAAFGDSAITFERIAKAIATFERTILSGNSAYDLYLS
jgi:cytochrome c peroxidase